MEIVLYDCYHQEKKTSKSGWLKKTGYALVILSLAALTLTAGPIALIEILYRLEKKSQVQSQNYSYLPSSKENKQEQILKEAAQYGVTTDFSLVIPKIKAATKVVPNINPADEEEYKAALKEGVAHALGTSFPGSKGTVYLFAHSTNSLANVTQYNAIFYLLKELVPQDKIIIFFGGQKFEYEVTAQFKTASDDLQWLNNDSQKERLVLQTCWPPGTTFQRLIVVAQPTSS